jgi:hypothetical protein
MEKENMSGELQGWVVVGGLSVAFIALWIWLYRDLTKRPSSLTSWQPEDEDIAAASMWFPW